MSSQRFAPEFKDEAARQPLERRYPVTEVAQRLGVSAHSLYKWIKTVKPNKSDQQATELVEAESEILMAVWRRKPRSTLIQSDQGSQYGSDAWLRFCREHHLEPSMSRRGNCRDNAVAEWFFSSLKKERIKNVSTEREIWPGPTSSTTLGSSTIDREGSPISSPRLRRTMHATAGDTSADAAAEKSAAPIMFRCIPTVIIARWPILRS